MIVVIDNYDSFVYNLARYITLAGHECRVVRNDAIDITGLRALNPEALVVSPGPCAPQQAGISIEAIKQFGPQIPVLGVCLGHQCIGEAYGGRTVQSAKPMHGKASRIAHDGSALFTNMPSPMKAGRYHSLLAELPLNAPLEITARCEDDHIMAMQHKTYPVYGVQFHPESVLTENGMQLIENFSQIVKNHQQMRVAA